jgi:hypothetical protein
MNDAMTPHSAPARIRNGGACPACGGRVRMPMWRMTLARASLVLLAFIVAVASSFGMGRSAAGESTRGQAPRSSYNMTCKQCGALLTISL